MDQNTQKQASLKTKSSLDDLLESYTTSSSETFYASSSTSNTSAPSNDVQQYLFLHEDVLPLSPAPQLPVGPESFFNIYNTPRRQLYMQCHDCTVLTSRVGLEPGVYCSIGEQIQHVSTNPQTKSYNSVPGFMADFLLPGAFKFGEQNTAQVAASILRVMNLLPFLLDNFGKEMKRTVVNIAIQHALPDAVGLITLEQFQYRCSATDITASWVSRYIQRSTGRFKLLKATVTLPSQPAPFEVPELAKIYAVPANVRFPGRPDACWLKLRETALFVQSNLNGRVTDRLVLETWPDNVVAALRAETAARVALADSVQAWFTEAAVEGTKTLLLVPTPELQEDLGATKPFPAIRVFNTKWARLRALARFAEICVVGPGTEIQAYLAMSQEANLRWKQEGYSYPGDDSRRYDYLFEDSDEEPSVHSNDCPADDNDSAMALDGPAMNEGSSMEIDGP